MKDETQDMPMYEVVANVEEQYSIWPAGLDIPPGWHCAGRRGSKDECLRHIREVWTDLRPLSLRQAMDVAGPSKTGQQTIEI